MDLTFVDDLPPITHRDGKRQKVVEALKNEPGRWARIPGTFSAAYAATFKRDYPGVETAKRGRHVFARWMGDRAKPRRAYTKRAK